MGAWQQVAPGIWTAPPLTPAEQHAAELLMINRLIASGHYKSAAQALLRLPEDRR